MQVSDVKQTHSWRQALDLGPGLIRLAEDLPASEEMGLSWQLRKLMVDLPTAIAVDLMGRSNDRHDVILRLVAVLELVEKVYPALDTAATRAEADRLIERLTGDQFRESLAAATPPPADEPEEPTDAPAPEAAPEAMPVTPAPSVTPAPAPAPMPAAPAPAPAPAMSAGVPAHDSVTASVPPIGAPPVDAPAPAPADPAASVPLTPAEAAPAPAAAPTHIAVSAAPAPAQEDHVQPNSQ
jgi:hypothetical protein